MSNFFKFTGAKITETQAVTSGKRSGGNMTRLRCGGLPQEADTLFSSKKEWSISLLTEWGIIPTLFYVLPKSQGKNNQNSLKKRKLEIGAPGKIPKICPNFDNDLSIFQIISHYCPAWAITVNPEDRPSIANEFELNMFFFEDYYSERGLIMIYNPERQFELNSLNFNSNSRNHKIQYSIAHKLAEINTSEDVRYFIERWKDYLSTSTEENDIEQKRDDFERIGFECYFKRVGVDAPACKITLYDESGKIEFNIDMELKHDARNFFNKKEASNLVKYPRLPLIVCSNINSYKPVNEIQQYIHPVISLTTLMEFFSNNPLSYMAIIDGGNNDTKVKLAFNPKTPFEKIRQKRLALSGLIMNELDGDTSLGTTKLAKIIYTIDTACELNLADEYKRERFGPLDQRMIYNGSVGLHANGKSFQYFEPYKAKLTGISEKLKDESQTLYRPLHNFGELIYLSDKLFSEEITEIRRILSIFKRLDTPQSEIVATLYACWNDKLIDNKNWKLDQKVLLDEFFNKWHEEKKKFKQSQIVEAIKWLQKINLVPRGTGKKTVHKPDPIPPEF